MPPTIDRRAITLLAAVFLAVTTGCSPGTTAPTPTPVRGTLTVKGQPAGGATVVFHPTSESGQKASGRTEANGEFRLTTVRASDGAVPGEYAVTVAGSDASPTPPVQSAP